MFLLDVRLQQSQVCKTPVTNITEEQSVQHRRNAAFTLRFITDIFTLVSITVVIITVHTTTVRIVNLVTGPQFCSVEIKEQDIVALIFMLAKRVELLVFSPAEMALKPCIRGVIYFLF